MFKAKSVISILAVIFLVTQSYSFSQGKTLDKSSESVVKQTDVDINPNSKIFKLYNSIETEYKNVTIIKFELGEEADVILTVYDSKGDIIETLIDDTMDAGIYNVNCKSKDNIVTGELTYKLEVKGISGIKNMFAVK